jgi:Flp pilus assembly protein TadG
VRRDERGAVAVEFALVVPLFLVLVGAAAYFAWHLYVESQLERAAQRAARYAAVPTTDGTYAYRQCDVVDELNRRLSTTSVQTANVEVRDAAGALAQTACPGSETAARPTGYVRVRVERELDNPFASVVSTLLGRQRLTLSGSGEARVEESS